MPFVRMVRNALCCRAHGRGTHPVAAQENISSFLKGCRALGVPEHDLFCTADLYEGKGMMQARAAAASARRPAPRASHLPAAARRRRC